MLNAGESAANQYKRRLRVFVACLVLVGLAITALSVLQLSTPPESVGGRVERRLQEELEEEIVLTKTKKGEKKEAGKKSPEQKQEKLQQQQRQQMQQAKLCEDINFPNMTLQLELEAHMSNLFPTAKENRYEASDVMQLGDNYYVVYDNLYKIGKIDVNLSSTSDNILLPYVQKVSGSSGYEGIAYDEVKHHYYLMIESEQGDLPGTHHGVIEQVCVHESLQTYSLVQRCESEYVFPTTNKGFEGAAIIYVKKNMYMLALCEGNFCSGGMKGKELGNGRILVLQRRPAMGSASCMWRTVRELPLPSVAMFQDYSALAIRKTDVPNLYDIAVTSQENSQLWVGQLSVGRRLDLTDWELTSGSVFNFPRDENCGPLFCSIEGIGFLDDNRFVAVSDKGGGTAPACVSHDESIHIFKLP